MKITEGSEPPEFWDSLGGKTEYASGKWLEEVTPSHPPRLFQCSNASGHFRVEEIFDFAQEVYPARVLYPLLVISHYLPSPPSPPLPFPPLPSPPLPFPPQVVSEGSASEPDSSSQAQSGDELAESEEETKMQKGRQFVYKELVATEKDYIRDLECVVNVSVLLDHSEG